MTFYIPDEKTNCVDGLLNLLNKLNAIKAPVVLIATNDDSGFVAYCSTWSFD